MPDLAAVQSPAASPSSASGSAEVTGHRFRDLALPRSPLTPKELELLKEAVLFTEEDARYLRLAGEIMLPRLEGILDVWYGLVRVHPLLVRHFSNEADGKPTAEHFARLRARVGQWIRNTTTAEYDQAWLDHQQKMELRRSQSVNDQRDAVLSVDEISFRYFLAFMIPIVLTVEPFLAESIGSSEDLERMQAAWTKSLVLQTVFWSLPSDENGWR